MPALHAAALCGRPYLQLAIAKGLQEVSEFVIRDHINGVLKHKPRSLTLVLLWPTLQQRGHLNHIYIGSDKLRAGRAPLFVDEGP
jgi:hypothetical protein